jgi:hypothetical protein
MEILEWAVGIKVEGVIEKTAELDGDEQVGEGGQSLLNTVRVEQGLAGKDGESSTSRQEIGRGNASKMKA